MRLGLICALTAVAVVATAGVAVCSGTPAAAAPSAATPSAAARVSDLSAVVVRPGAVQLTWTNPGDPDFAGLVIRRADGPVAPASAAAGVAVARTSAAATSYLDAGVVPGATYSYAAFPIDTANRTGPAARTSVRAARYLAGVLDSGAALSGTVRQLGSAAALGNVWVTVFAPNGTIAADVPTRATGFYRIDGLAPGSYRVCFDGARATGGSAPAGYLSRCFGTATWDRGAVPSDATAVEADAGAVRSRVDTSLSAAAGLSGAVTAADTGASLTNFYVTVFDAAGNYVPASTRLDPLGGGYTVTGLTPAAGGYTVCVDPSASSSTGYLGQCYASVPWQLYRVPAGVTYVPASAGTMQTDIDAAVQPAGAISGTVLSAAHHLGVADVSVQAFLDGRFAGSTYTGSDGSYTLSGLVPDSSAYTVCFSTSFASGGGVTTGYLDKCYAGTPWDGGAVPPDATQLGVSAGATTSGIGVRLVAAGAIAGRVTGAGEPLGDVAVNAYAAGRFVASALTGYDGTYRLAGLAPSTTGYTVCFDASQATLGSSAGGYRSQCFQNQAWTPWSGIPSTVTPVTVTALKVHAGISAKLARAAAISGTVSSASDSSGLGGVQVEVLTSTGAYVDSGWTYSDGGYLISGLTPSASGYRVCFVADSATGGSSPTGYADQCYTDAPWQPGDPPTGSKAVRARAGVLSSGIDAQLADA